MDIAVAELANTEICSCPIIDFMFEKKLKI